MANKKPYRRRKFNLRKVRFDGQNLLGTLADRAVITSGATGTSNNAYRCMSLKATWAIKNLTPGQGPITFGYAHSDYSVTEIKACLEQQNAIDVGDKVAQEIVNRLVRIVGTFSGELAQEKFNEGRPWKTKLNWLIGIGDAVNLFAYNDSGAALSSGTPAIETQGEMWVKDGF